MEKNWQMEFEKSITTLEEFEKHVKISSDEKAKIQRVIKVHPMKITRYYLSLIDKNDPKDPIRRLCVPSSGELSSEGTYDTSGEKENTKMTGLQHKYKQTALILATNRCATYCRHCFRKRLVGRTTNEVIAMFDEAATYISDHEEINNVLISGGDPFILQTHVIEKFLEMLSPIKHLDFIRFGTRTPVTFPDRILMDKSLVDVLGKHSRKDRRLYVVTHFNHPREITDKSTSAIDALLKVGVVVNNQTVLLRGVNDDPRVMAELQNKLVSIGVNPYYIFQCRPVKRVKSSFQVPLAEGYRIMEEAKKKMSGHSKRFKYMMSHKTGKIEIVGVKGGHMYFKRHQARNENDLGEFFCRKLNPTAGWLDDL